MNRSGAEIVRDGDNTFNTAQQERGDSEKYIDNCGPNISFDIISPVALTAANLSEYVLITSETTETIPGQSIAGSGTYKLAPLTPYREGRLYSIRLLDARLSFAGEDESIRTITFRIHKDEVGEVEYKDGMIDILWENVTTIAENTYLVDAEIDKPEAGTIIRLWDGVESDNMVFRKILAATEIEDEEEGKTYLLLETDTCLPGEIVEDLDVYFEELMPLWGLMRSLDTEQIAQDASSSAGTAQLAAILESAIMSDPAVQALLAEGEEIGPGDISYTALAAPVDNEQASAIVPLSSGRSGGGGAVGIQTQRLPNPNTGTMRYNVPKIGSLLSLVNVTCYIGSTDNSNFPDVDRSWAGAAGKAEYEAQCRKTLQGLMTEEEIQQTIDDA